MHFPKTKKPGSGCPAFALSTGNAAMIAAAWPRMYALSVHPPLMTESPSPPRHPHAASNKVVILSEIAAATESKDLLSPALSADPSLALGR
jgi:hypothetical protein